MQPGVDPAEADVRTGFNDAVRQEPRVRDEPRGRGRNFEGVQIREATPEKVGTVNGLQVRPALPAGNRPSSETLQWRGSGGIARQELRTAERQEVEESDRLRRGHQLHGVGRRVPQSIPRPHVCLARNKRLHHLQRVRGGSDVQTSASIRKSPVGVCTSLQESRASRGVASRCRDEECPSPLRAHRRHPIFQRSPEVCDQTLQGSYL
mmetsp:Transcript_87064/g.281058  ORF Transcript_87064/g.281058 Transcript_87064/m.281058 type:complete len:207 (+) Transcript_87064:1136-1756(+)